jgi:hypothetical protein
MRSPEFFINDEEKHLHFELGSKKIQNVEEDLEERFRVHYQGEIEYNNLYAEINDMLESGKKVPDVKEIIEEKYIGVIKKEDLFDLLTEVVISRQVKNEKKRYKHQDEENMDVA